MYGETRLNTAKWDSKYNRWRIKVQREGVIKEFYCSQKGNKGKQIVNAKADKWLRERTINGKTKVETLIQPFLDKKKKEVGTSRIKNLESIFNVWIVPSIGKKQFDNIKNYMLQDILDFMFEKGKSKKTINNAKQLLENFFKFARKKEITRLVPELEINKKAPVTKRDTLQPDDIYILFSSDKTFYYKKEIKDFFIYAYRFLVTTGLRRGELIGLKNEYVLTGDTIPYYNKQLLNPKHKTFLLVKNPINEYNEVTEGKTENAYRYEVLSDSAIKILKDQREWLNKLGIKSEYIFPDLSGDHVKPWNFYNQFKKYAEYNNLSRTTVHELRHTYISLNKNILDEEAMLKFTGQADIATNKIYQHALMDDLANKVNPVDLRLKNAIKYGENLLK